MQGSPAGTARASPLLETGGGRLLGGNRGGGGGGEPYLIICARQKCNRVHKRKFEQEKGGSIKNISFFCEKT